MLEANTGQNKIQIICNGWHHNTLTCTQHIYRTTADTCRSTCKEVTSSDLPYNDIAHESKTWTSFIQVVVKFSSLFRHLTSICRTAQQKSQISLQSGCPIVWKWPISWCWKLFLPIPASQSLPRQIPCGITYEAFLKNNTCSVLQSRGNEGM